MFTAKTLSFGSLKIQTPCKLFDLNGLNIGQISPLKSLDTSLFESVKILERSHLVSPETFCQAADDSNPNLLKNYLKLKQDSLFKNKLLINTLTLEFNPYNISDADEYIESLMALYHGRSDLLLIPNLKIQKYVSLPHQKFYKETITSQEDYVQFVDTAYENLKFRNSKPIFIPLSLKYGNRRFTSILDSYLSKGYRNFWIDFEGGSELSKTQFIRSYHKKVADMKLEEEVVLYGSNIRREQHPRREEIACLAGDILSAPLGIDIIGVNREPKAWPGKNPPQKTLSDAEKMEYKGRMLDRKSYMYMHHSEHANHDGLLKKYHISQDQIAQAPKFFSSVINTFEMNEEFKFNRETIDEKGSIMSYLEGKKTIDETTLKGFKKIEKKSKSVSLDDFF
ncbi:MAG: hypothetical protein M0P20_05970 [Methanocorpusculum sp.]|nr:hypothetical protein [Methanocorpusculum sp.]MDY3203109.1 hypothetical protein [Methanocorpusculum sp.]